ncbi:MAG TPA: carbohydrate-binding protein, partial [Thermoanaerobaculia bacterium]
AYRADDMDVGAIPAGGYHIGYLADGEWAKYTVNTAAAATYNVTLRWASDYAGTTSFKVYEDNILLTTQTVTKTSLTAGDWHRYLTKTFAIPLKAGTHVLRVEFTQGAWNFDSMVFAQAAACAAPTFGTPLATSVTLNEPGLWQLTPNVSGAATYQWYKDGFVIPGQTARTLTIANAEQGKDLGVYKLVATSSCGASAPSTETRLFRVRCSASPGLSSENLYRALSGKTDYCYWQEDLAPNFLGGGTDVNGSYNKPVIAAAVAFIRGDATFNSTWWTSYLNGELGKPGGAANWVYGGNEIGSFTYQHFNTISILSVALHAQNQGNLALRNLAWEWLRNTLTLNALAAAPTNLASIHVDDQSTLGTGYTGPYVAMAGERSNWPNWTGSERSILLSQAIGLPHNGQGETAGVKNTRVYIESRFAAGASPNAYGLTTNQADALKNLITAGTVPATLIGGYLSTTLRTKMTYHLVGWQSPEVVRVTLMTRNNHTYTAPTFGAVYFTNARKRSGKELHLLWPWSGVFANDNYKDQVTHGTATINLAGGYIQVEQPGNTLHPYMLQTISGLPPASTRKYWVVLSPTAPPALQ